MRRMKRITRGIAIAAMVAMVAASGNSQGVRAAADYTPLSNISNQAEFDKYLVLDKTANVPFGEMAISIEKGDVVSASEGKMPILQGVEGIKLVKVDNSTDVDVKEGGQSATLKFDPMDNTTLEASVPDGDIIFWTTTDTEDEKVDIKTLKIDISGCTFKEPGIYRWKIKESGSIPGVTNDISKGTSVRYLDVYIIDDNGTLKFQNFLIHTTADAPGRNVDTDSDGTYDTSATLTQETKGTEDKDKDQKSTGFTNVYDSQNLEFGKEVTGNQGSKDKRFKVTVKTTNANEKSVYPLAGNWTKEPAQTPATIYNADSMKSNNVDKLTGKQLNDGYTFYLSDGEYVKIQGLEVVSGEKTVKYEIAEDNEDYTKTEKITEAVAKYNDTAHIDEVKGEIITGKDIYTGFVNDRSGAIPTGVIVSVAAPAIIGIIVVGGIIILLIRNKRRKSEEE